MPNLVYRAAHQPPRWWEHWLAHGMGLGIAIAAIGAGIQVGITLTGHRVLSRAAEALPPWTLALMTLALFAGATAYAAGVLVKWSLLARSQALMQVGLSGMATGWLVRGIALFVRGQPQDMTSAWVSASLALGCILSLVGSHISTPRVEADARQIRGGE